MPYDAPAQAELHRRGSSSLYDLVFESNAIEGAGTSSRAENRKIVKEALSNAFPIHDAFRQEGGGPLPAFTTADWDATFGREGLTLDHLRRSMSMGDRSRSFEEVRRHAIAAAEAMLRALTWHQVNLLRGFAAGGTEGRRAELEPDIQACLAELGEADADPWGAPPRFLTERWLSSCHRRLAEGLLGADAGVVAGDYRRDSRVVEGFVFPAPESVPSCMARFARETAQVGLDDLLDYPFQIAARFSYGFVRIHPFPDFNGRLSRIILMMVLRAAGLPFYLTLRGDSTGRKRYHRSLRSANAGDMKPYEALIAMRTVEMFEDIDRNFAAAGLPSLLTFAPES
ncbi:MAG: Fic family protein [Armatimonadetes bacterium]|nr:Fic family protein [Armatimonadota bacterium]